MVLTSPKNNIFYNKQILQKNKNNFEFNRKISSTTLILEVYKEYCDPIEASVIELFFYNKIMVSLISIL